ncbi:hypothetical protein [Methylocystis parvus]|uniref:SH3 domain-containing protein n=1 Tax=Methylocystis parvus TaxID=134 RepID=A0A6B8M9L7_9HYPH|nr:hypothetical protein [Methylocystis parvus]QGM99298.1 hypothetical protein F7D14_18640 [Methylocystis parvus]WBK00312.1 hypothetical protein MMG94_00890 [Methylocystis parvus OBBP]
MRKLRLSLLALAALAGGASNANAYEAMLGGNFVLHTQPHGRHLMTLAAGDIVNIDHCDHSWCAVTHGPHAGYLYMPRTLDGNLYGPHGGVAGYQDGGPAELGLAVISAPVDAAGDVVNAGVSVLR